MNNALNNRGFVANFDDKFSRDVTLIKYYMTCVTENRKATVILAEVFICLHMHNHTVTSVLENCSWLPKNDRTKRTVGISMFMYAFAC